MGASRIGGRPDLPPATPWPTAVYARGGAPREFPLAFVAQFKLGDLARHTSELPPAGLLAFFVLDELRVYRALGTAKPGIPRDKRVRVLFVPPRTRLERRELPAALPPGAAVPTRKPAFRRVETWPQAEGTVIGDKGAKPPRGGIALSAAQWQEWAECAPENPPAQLLGHPCGCEFPIGPEPDARLLLALDAKTTGLPWDLCGRNGHLFIGIPGDALSARAWEQAFHKEW